MSNWTKVKSIVAVKDDDPEEIEDKPIYDIKKMPDPKFCLKIIKPLNYFIQPAEFQAGEMKIPRRNASMPEDKKEIHPCPTLPQD